MNKLGMTVLTVAVIGSCSAWAEEKPARQRGEGDAERLAAHFKAADTDGDGKISLAEFKALDAKRLEMMKERLGDRYDAERAAQRPPAEERFARLDTNEDGFISQDEFAAARRRAGAGRGQRDGGEEETRERTRRGQREGERPEGTRGRTRRGQRGGGEAKDSD